MTRKDDNAGGGRLVAPLRVQTRGHFLADRCGDTLWQMETKWRDGRNEGTNG